MTMNPTSPNRPPPPPQPSSPQGTKQKLVGFEALWDDEAYKVHLQQHDAARKAKEASDAALRRRMESLRWQAAEAEAASRVEAAKAQADAARSAALSRDLRAKREQLEAEMRKMMEEEWQSAIDYEAELCKADELLAQVTQYYAANALGDKTPALSPQSPVVQRVTAPNLEAVAPKKKPLIYRFGLLNVQAKFDLAARIEEAQRALDETMRTITEIESYLQKLEIDAIAADPKTADLAVRKSDAEARRAEIDKLRAQEGDPHLAADYLLFEGIATRGQLYFAFITNGLGGGAEVSINPLGAVGINAKVAAGISASKAKTRSLVVYRQASKVHLGAQAWDVPSPVVLHSLVGASWELEGKLSAEVSLGWEAKIGGGVVRKNDEDGGQTTEFEAEPSAKTLATADREMRHEQTMEFEMFAIGVEAKAGVEVSGSVGYETFYAEDPLPLYYSDELVNAGRLRSHLAVLLQEGSTKTMIKGRACQLMQDHKNLFPGEDLALHNEYGIRSLAMSSFPDMSGFDEKSAAVFREALERHIEERRKSEAFKKFDSYFHRVTTVSSQKVIEALSRHLNAKSLEDAQKDPAALDVLQQAIDYVRALEHFQPPAKSVVKASAHEFIVANPTLFVAPSRPFKSYLGLSEISSLELVSLLIEGRNRPGAPPRIVAQADRLLSQLGSYAADSASTVDVAFEIIKQHHDNPSHKGKLPCWCQPLPEKKPDAVRKYLDQTPSPCPDVAELRARFQAFDAEVEHPAFLSITAHKRAAGGEMFVKAGASASVIGGNAARAEARLGAGRSGMRKRSVVRFQTVGLATSTSSVTPVQVLTTYDSFIKYSQVAKGVQAELNVSAAALGKQVNLSDSKKGAKALEAIDEFNTWSVANRITYKTAIAVWQRPDRKGQERGDATLLHGSGVAIGSSFVVGSLRALFGNCTPAEFRGRVASEHKLGGQTKRLKFMTQMCEALELDALVKDPNQPMQNASALAILSQFLGDEAVMDALRKESLSAEGSVLIEATYRVKAGSVVNWESRRADKGARRLTTLAEDAGKQILAMPRALGAMRLRSRRKDHQNRDEDLFSIGFSAAGTGIGIRLTRIERAGHDAVIDLVTRFCRKTDGVWKFSAPSTAEDMLRAHEDETPAAPLFCQ